MTEFPIQDGVEFRHCPNHAGYCVGDDGSVWSCRYSRGRKWRKMKPRPTPRKGRLRVDIDRKWIQVHRLVLEAFVGPCPDGMQGLHWDDDVSNNCISNLRWGTPRENKVDASRNGRLTFPRGEQHGCAKLKPEQVKEIRNRVSDGESLASMGRLFGVTTSGIYRIVHRKTWAHV